MSTLGNLFAREGSERTLVEQVGPRQPGLRLNYTEVSKFPTLRGWKQPRVWQPEMHKSSLPPQGSYISEVDPPPPKLERNVEYIGRNAGAVYGNYVGPNGFNTTDEKGQRTAPLTPVDQVAYMHDQRYEALAREYGYSELDYFKHTFFSLNPELQAKTAAVDFFVGIDMAKQYGRGVASGWYRLDDVGANSYHKAFATDTAWAFGMTMYEAAQGMHRVGMVGLGLIDSAGNAILSSSWSIFDKSRGHGFALEVVGGLASGVVGLAGALLKVGAVVGAVVWSATSIPFMLGTIVGAAVAGVGIAVGAYVLAKTVSSAVWVGKKVSSGAKRAWNKVKSWFLLSEAVCLENGLGADVRNQVIEFRDQYIRGRDREFLRRYYSRSPLIHEAISLRSDSAMVWRRAYRLWFRDFLLQLDANNWERALDLFKSMFDWLDKESGVVRELGVVYHWKTVGTVF